MNDILPSGGSYTTAQQIEAARSCMPAPSGGQCTAEQVAGLAVNTLPLTDDTCMTCLYHFSPDGLTGSAGIDATQAAQNCVCASIGCADFPSLLDDLGGSGGSGGSSAPPGPPVIPECEQASGSSCQGTGRNWLGDGNCDTECNIAECNYDGDDCAPESQCSEVENGCARSWLGDGECDDICNNMACNYDSGDCAVCDGACVAV
eukprot:COSAG02_NODE_16764_length_1057_cov_1.382046_1_plen_204_part_00